MDLFQTCVAIGKQVRKAAKRARAEPSGEEAACFIHNCLEAFAKRSYSRKLSTMTSSKHKPEIACVVKISTLLQ